MRAYYQRLLPFRYLFQWLNHSPSPGTDFGHREFAFTLHNDAYLRYQAFPTADRFVSTALGGKGGNKDREGEISRDP